MIKRRVLILCTGDSARSQMAEGLLRYQGGEAFEVESAGVAPSSVRPEAIAAMRLVAASGRVLTVTPTDGVGGLTVAFG